MVSWFLLSHYSIINLFIFAHQWYENERDHIVPFLDKYMYINAQVPEETYHKQKFLVTSSQTNCHTMCHRYKKKITAQI